MTENYKGVSKSFRTGRLKRELQTVQLSAIRCSYIAILYVSLVSFAAITLCVASGRVFIVVSLYFVISPETFGYTLVYLRSSLTIHTRIICRWNFFRKLVNCCNKCGTSSSYSQYIAWSWWINVVMETQGFGYSFFSLLLPFLLSDFLIISFLSLSERWSYSRPTANSSHCLTAPISMIFWTHLAFVINLLLSLMS
jgi:hypothetical protein